MSIRKKAQYKFCLSIFLFLFIWTGCQKHVKTGVTEINFAFWETGEGYDFLLKLIREFETDNPQLKVVPVQITSYSMYDQKILTMMAGGTAPDIFEINSSTIGDYISKGTLLKLDEYMEESEEMKPDDYFESAIYGFRYDGMSFGKGSIYGIPKDTSPYCIFYNRDAFRKSGLRFPDGNWNWDEFLDIAKRLTLKDENGIIKQYGVTCLDFWSLIYQNGGRIYSEDNRECLMDKKEVIEALDFSSDLPKKYKVAPLTSGNQTFDDMFMMGRAAMHIGGRYIVPGYEKNIRQFDWSVALLPEGRLRSSVLAGSSGYAVYSKTRDSEAAWKLMEFLVGRKGQVKTANKGWNVPSMKSIASSEWFAGRAGRDGEINSIFLKGMEIMKPLPLNPYITWSLFNDIMWRNYELSSLGKKTTFEAVSNAVKEVNKIIKDNIEGTR